MSSHFFLPATNSLHLLTPTTWRSLSTSSFHLFLGLPLLLVPSSYWVKIFLGILSSSILSRWPNQLILCLFIHFTYYYYSYCCWFCQCYCCCCCCFYHHRHVAFVIINLSCPVVALCTNNFNIKHHRRTLCPQKVLLRFCGCQKKLRLFPYTALTDWFLLTEMECVYCVEQTNLEIEFRIIFIFKELMLEWK